MAAPGAGAAVTAAARAERVRRGGPGPAGCADRQPGARAGPRADPQLPPGPAAAVHQGATSQDIVDTAAMLLARQALGVISDDLAAAAAAAARLAAVHRDTIMIGRTLLQQAVPVTFGLVAAGWLTGLDEAAAGLDRVAASRSRVQFGGAAGTLSALGDRGPEVAALLAAELGLHAPTLPWHTDRLRITEIAGALGVTGVLSKIARDVTLLAQSEVGEVAEGGGDGGRGGSSAMPHKRNPVAAIAVLGCPRQTPGLVATLVAAAEQEHQRAAGAWHAEWEPLADLLRLTGSAAAWAADLLGGLEADPGRMRRNLDAAGGFPMAEHVASLLAPALGSTAAHDLLAQASAGAVAEGRTLGEALLDRLDTGQLAAAGVTPEQVTAALDPAGYLGAAAEFVDAALAAHTRAAS